MSMRLHAGGFPNLLPGMALLVLGLAACQTSPPPPRPSAEPATLPPPPGAREFQVVPAESLLIMRVYRGGPMARLGHNHVIASHDLQGVVHVAEDATATRFDIRLPVGALTVDEPPLRAQAGADFSSEVPEEAREGTRRNLLSRQLLDGSNYPEIRLRTLDVARAGEKFEVGVEITLKGQVRQARVPVAVELQDHALVARGEFSLKQSDLGLEPFSVAMGALVVLDEMKISFEVLARETAPGPDGRSDFPRPGRQ